MEAADAKPISRAQAKRNRKLEAQRFKRSHRAERKYAKELKNVAKQVGRIVNLYAPKGKVQDLPGLSSALAKYSEMLRPFAVKAAAALIQDIARKDTLSWKELSQQVGVNLKKEIRYAPTGRAMKELMNEQVELIQSLPREAARRVHKFVIEGMAGGVRAKEAAKEIARSGHVTESRAMLIARTETTRAATAMTQSRAEYVGSTHYIWRTSEDSDVRSLHRKLNGKIIAWDDPPIAGEDGERAHAGAIYNCRCYPEPLIPDVIE